MDAHFAADDDHGHACGPEAPGLSCARDPQGIGDSRDAPVLDHEPRDPSDRNLEHEPRDAPVLYHLHDPSSCGFRVA